MGKRFNQPALAAFGLLALFFAVSIPVMWAHELYLHFWLVWNLFLAALPALFAGLFGRCRVKTARAALAALWLLFFPNAHYLLTDLIHLRTLSFGTPNDSLYAWLTLMQTGMAVFLSALLGHWSLDVMRRAVRDRFGAGAGWLAAGLACAACGFGVYLGRFLRLNSWDVLRPGLLVQRILLSVDGAALRFSAAFAGYTLFTYLAFSAFRALSAPAGAGRGEGTRPADERLSQASQALKRQHP